jgi:FAD binding domain
MLLTDTFTPDVDALRDRLEGTVVLPTDMEYDDARAPWHVGVEQRPALVAFPRSARDVQHIVDFAREASLRVAMQGTGHSAGVLGSLDQAVLVRTSEMRGVTIDERACLARVEAGALWGDVASAASEHGLAALAGSSPSVGVVGYTLGGGIGWLSRRYGLASERVTAIEVVTADGHFVRADRRNDPDLFWALRGGGGAYAAVVALEFELIPLTTVHAGMMLWPWERAREVLQAWRAFTKTAPDTVTTSARIIRVPPLPDVPEFLRGRDIVVIDGAVVGGDAAAVLAPLRALEPELDTFADVPPAALTRIHMDPEEPSPGVSDHALLDALPEEVVDALVDVAGPGSESPLAIVEIRHLGGALARAGSGALGSLPADYLLFAAGMPMDTEAAAAVEAAFGRVGAAVAPCVSRRAFQNFAERRTDAAALFGSEAAERLRAVKARVDAEDLFLAAHPVTDE